MDTAQQLRRYPFIQIEPAQAVADGFIISTRVLISRADARNTGGHGLRSAGLADLFPLFFQTDKGFLLVLDQVSAAEFILIDQFNQILQVKELMGQGMDKSTIASRMKLQPFVAGKIMLQAKTFSREQILSYVNLCVDAEESVKTGRLTDRLAVELLIAKTY